MSQAIYRRHRYCNGLSQSTVDSSMTMVCHKLSTVDSSLTIVCHKLSTVDSNITMVCHKLSTVDSNITMVCHKLSTVDSSITMVRHKLSTIDSNITMVCHKLSTVDSNITPVCHKLSTVDSNGVSQAISTVYIITFQYHLPRYLQIDGYRALETLCTITSFKFPFIANFRSLRALMKSCITWEMLRILPV